jgi:Transglutaminase-like superfamily
MTRMFSGEARYRTIDEADIIDLLLYQGWAFEVRAGARAAAEQEARATLDRFVAMGLRHHIAEGGVRRFDPAEVHNLVKWAGMELGEPTWRERYVATTRRLVWEAQLGCGPGDAPSTVMLCPQRYAVTLRRTFNLADWCPGERVRLRLPLPLEDAALEHLRIRFLPPLEAAAQPEVAPGRLDTLIEVPAGGEVTMGVKAEFTARLSAAAQTSVALSRREIELYTRPNEGLIKVSERVNALAANLAGSESDPLAIVQRYWAFMLNDLSHGTIHHNELDPARPVDWALEHGWCDCQVGSALLVALCRARGIPSRLVSGYHLYATAPGFHSWLETWVEGVGWAPFDLLSWDLSAGGIDEGWRDYFFGRINHRMAVERPPRLFSGAGSVRLPRAWHLLYALDGLGTAIAFHALETGALVFRDHIEVERLD